MTDLQQKVDAMLNKAAAADKSEDALRFSQAALNAANTYYALGGAKPSKD